MELHHLVAETHSYGDDDDDADDDDDEDDDDDDDEGDDDVFRLGTASSGS